MKFPLLLSIAFLLLILFSLESQEKWRKLTTADGLSSNVVNQIYQTENGDIWIGTKRGIDRYNGVFQPFFYQTDSGVELESDIFEMTTGQPIIKLIINKTNHPRSVTTEISLFDGLEWDQPDFFRDNDIMGSKMPEFAVVDGSKLWISTLWDGLVGFDGKNWQRYDVDVGTDWLVKTPDGRLWTGVWGIMNGIASFDGQKWNLEFNTNNAPFGNVSVNTVLSTSTGEILLGTDEATIRQSLEEVDKQVETLNHREVIQDVLAHGFFVVSVVSEEQAIEVANLVAPEHIELQVDATKIERFTSAVTTAGAILQGHDTPTVLGDFAAGPSHVLPTGRAARFSSGLRLSDFFRRSSILRYDLEALRKAENAISRFSSMEKLDAHGRSLSIRLKNRE
mgnify:CR=1 FL=1